MPSAWHCAIRANMHSIYFFLCLFFLKRFLRLWVAILCLFLFFPLGMANYFEAFL